MFAPEMAILVAFDDSDPSKKALEYALDQFPNEEIITLHVIDPARHIETSGIHVDWSAEMDRREAVAEALSEEAEVIAASRDTTVTTRTILGRPEREIVLFAEQEDVDHVVVGSRGRSGISRAILGSTADRVVRRSPVPVTVVR